MTSTESATPHEAAARLQDAPQAEKDQLRRLSPSLNDTGFHRLLDEARQAGTQVTMDLLSNMEDLVTATAAFLRAGLGPVAFRRW